MPTIESGDLRIRTFGLFAGIRRVPQCWKMVLIAMSLDRCDATCLLCSIEAFCSQTSSEQKQRRSALRRRGQSARTVYRELRQLTLHQLPLIVFNRDIRMKKKKKYYPKMLV